MEETSLSTKSRHVGQVQKWVQKKKWGFVTPQEGGIASRNNGQNLRFELKDVEFDPESIRKGMWISFSMAEDNAAESSHAGRSLSAREIRVAETPVVEDPKAKAAADRKARINSLKALSTQWLNGQNIADHGNTASEISGFVSSVGNDLKGTQQPDRVSTTFNGDGPKKVRIVIGSTFAEELQSNFEALQEATGFPANVSWLPYGTLFTSLTDTASSANGDDIDIVFACVRLEDFLYPHPEVMYDLESMQSAAKYDHTLLLQQLKQVTDGMIISAACTAAPRVVVMCPPSPVFADCDLVLDMHRAFEGLLHERLGKYANIYMISSKSLLDMHEGAVVFDEKANRLAHTPYTPEFHATLTLALGRMAHRVRPVQRKVIVVDCDNTLWGGAVGELGPGGIDIGGGFVDVQRFLVSQVELGMLVCLSSRNVESDVLAVFEERQADMFLSMGSIVSHQINWNNKSRSIREMSKDLELGLDSFIFIDDNPVECAEVSCELPEVAVVLLPDSASTFGSFLTNHWVFDRELTKRMPTAEDRARTAMYRANSERQKLLNTSASFDAFLASINLSIAIENICEGTLARSAQLTQRTNQFNSNKVVYSEEDLAAMQKTGYNISTVTVTDRFGHYGMIGLVIVAPSSLKDTLLVPNFLMSCRVLHRGVEHAMMRHLAGLARQAGASSLAFTWVPTDRNEPARAFLFSVPGGIFKPTGSAEKVPFPSGPKPPAGSLVIPVDVAESLAIAPLDIKEGNAENEKPTIAPAETTPHVPRGGDIGYYSDRAFSLSNATYRMLAMAAIGPTPPWALLCRLDLGDDGGAKVPIRVTSTWKRMLDSAGVDDTKLAKMEQGEFRRKMRHGVKLLVKDENKDNETYAKPAPPPGASEGYI